MDVCRQLKERSKEVTLLRLEVLSYVHATYPSLGGLVSRIDMLASREG